MGLFCGFDYFDDATIRHQTLGMTERSDDQPTTLEQTVDMTAQKISGPFQKNNSKHSLPKSRVIPTFRPNSKQQSQL